MKQLDVAEQNVEAARQTVVSDEADVALKQLEFDRAQTLLTKGAGTVDARDVADTALKQSRAALERDKALEASADRSVALAIANIESARAALELAEDRARLYDADGAVRRRHSGAPGRARRSRVARARRSSPSPTSTTSGCAPTSTSPTSARSGSARR